VLKWWVLQMVFNLSPSFFANYFRCFYNALNWLLGIGHVKLLSIIIEPLPAKENKGDVLDSELHKFMTVYHLAGTVLPPDNVPQCIVATCMAHHSQLEKTANDACAST